MKESVELTRTFKANAKTIYEAWLNSERHAEMINGSASTGNQEGDQFSMWDGYISGSNLKLTTNSEIQQNWRTTEFNVEDEDSLLTIQLKDIEGGCEFKLIHTHIPEGQTQYYNGWIDNYLEPMATYFG